MKHCFLFVLIILITSSCIKHEEFEVDNETQCVVDYSLAEQELTTLPLILHQHLSNARGSGAVKGYVPSCAPFTYVSGDTIDFDPVVTYTLNADAISCSAGDGKKREGQIKVVLTGRFQAQGTQCNIVLSNYVAGGIGYEADTLTLSNVGQTSSYTQFKMITKNARMHQGESHYSLSTDKTIALFPGKGSGPYETMYGTATGKSRSGEAYSAEMTTDVTKDYHCAFFKSGTISVQPSRFKERKVNYGEGVCDDEAEFTVNENKVAFKLK